MRYLSVLLGAVLVVFVASPVPAQEWSDEQIEVWNVVEKLVNHFWDGDIDAVSEMVHPDFIFWGSPNPVPGNKDMAVKWDKVMAERGGQYIAMRATPLTIQVFDGFAVVNFYVRGYQEANPGGAPAWATRRILMVLKQEGDTWLQVANYVDTEE